MNKYTVRVYAFIENLEGAILLMNEAYNNVHFTKFPGGGLEENEGILDALKRELKEELNLSFENAKQFHTTELHYESQFHKNTQVIACYYHIKITSKEVISIDDKDNKLLGMTWVHKTKLNDSYLTFNTDKEALIAFKKLE